ncbi:hypothetical protein, partial [Lacticaseibacillus paracasei]|uniref:hypothetical protein n=1 Tax=Lacticaseibacillus paracasei TaxID=1597 RepID=UPI001CDBE96F
NGPKEGVNPPNKYPKTSVFGLKKSAKLLKTNQQNHAKKEKKRPPKGKTASNDKFILQHQWT